MTENESFDEWAERVGRQKPATGNPKELEGMKKSARCHVPETSLAALHAAHNNGAAKYGHFNWRKEGVDVNTYLSAVERHIEAFKRALCSMQETFAVDKDLLLSDVDLVNMGFDETDPVTDITVPHLGAAMAGLSILHDALMQGKLLDNYSAPEVLKKIGGKPSNIACLDAGGPEPEEPAAEDFLGRVMVLAVFGALRPDYGVVKEMSADRRMLRFYDTEGWFKTAHYREATDVERCLISMTRFKG